MRADTPPTSIEKETTTSEKVYTPNDYQRIQQRIVRVYDLLDQIEAKLKALAEANA